MRIATEKGVEKRYLSKKVGSVITSAAMILMGTYAALHHPESEL